MVDNNSSIDAMIQNIVTVVFRIHFYYVTDKDLEQDLKQEGFLKAYELLASNNYDPYKNLRTFIYTGVRNAMTNYLYHNKKESHTSTESINSQEWQSYEKVTMDNYWEGKVFYSFEDRQSIEKLDINGINRICKKYNMFGDYRGKVLERLKDLGLYTGPVPNIEIQENSFILDCIVGEILWKIIKDN